jgi:uncharacterized cupin superfamily protein
MTLVQRVTANGAAPETSRPDPAKVVRGDPVHTTWNLEETDGLYAGLWQSTPGAWRVDWTEWEYFHILSGHCVLTGDDGSVQDLRAGDALIVRPGFKGVWETVETTLKEYVIRT